MIFGGVVVEVPENHVVDVVVDRESVEDREDDGSVVKDEGIACT